MLAPSLHAPRARSACVVWSQSAHAMGLASILLCLVSSMSGVPSAHVVLLPSCQLFARAAQQTPLLLVHLGVPGIGRGIWVLNGIWREFWREQGGGIVKQSEQIAYPN